MRYYKVQKGYNVEDYLSVDENELQKAIRAQISGKAVIFNEGSLTGTHIISITPDWNRMMGWKKDYRLTGEDFTEIGEARMRDSQEYLSFVSDNVDRQLQGLPPLPKLEPVHQISSVSKALAAKMKA